MKNVIKNKNLFVAENLLEITVEKPYLTPSSTTITLELDNIFELSTDEVVESLKTRG